MHDLTGQLNSVSFSFHTGKPLMTFEMEDRQSALIAAENLFGEKLSIKVGKWRNKRSLDANAYCWVLISRLAEKLKIPKTDIYRNAIREIGGNSDTVCIKTKAVDSLRSGWERNGLGWLTDTMPSKLEGCTNVVLYYGSSTYDSAQMGRLIENIQEECRLQGIETKSAEEVKSLLQQWE